MTLSDADCIMQCLSGDAEVFRILVERYQKPVLAFARGRASSDDSPEEIAQEAFIRAFTHLAKLIKREAFFSWLLGIVDRVIRETHRESARRHLAMAQFAQVNGRHVDEAAADPPDIELDQAIAALAEPYREVVLLRYYGGLSCNEVAERMQMPVGSVTKTLSRAYAQMREKLMTQMRGERVERMGCHHEV